MRRLIKAYPQFRFVVVYTREPHARQMGFKHIAQPLNLQERIALAKRTKAELKIDALFLVDPMGDPSRKLLGGIPNPAIFVEGDGKIRDKLSWADAASVSKLLKTWKPRAPKKQRGAPPKGDAARPAGSPRKREATGGRAATSPGPTPS